MFRKKIEIRFTAKITPEEKKLAFPNLNSLVGFFESPMQGDLL
jgi:hypothetical protein